MNFSSLPVGFEAWKKRYTFKKMNDRWLVKSSGEFFIHFLELAKPKNSKILTLLGSFDPKLYAQAGNSCYKVIICEHY